MNITKVIKWLILVFSLIIFCYQTQVAIQNLLDPPVIESSRTYNLADIEPPLITICPFGQWDNINEFGYAGRRQFLQGKYSESDSLISWGGQQNLTYGKLIGDMLPLNKELIIKGGTYDQRNERVDYEKKFYPKYGWCYEITNFTLRGDITLILIRPDKSDFQAEVFLTDKKLRTFSTVFSPSHHGSSIILTSNKVHTYVVDVEIISNIDPKKPENCKVYTNDEFEMCVDKIFQEIWKPIVNCNPPWLSLYDQCTGKLNISDTTWKALEKQPHSHTIFNLERMETGSAMEECKKASTLTQTNIIEKGTVSSEEWMKDSRLQLKIDKQVVHKTKMLGYGFSNFLIDMGSSLGFWFGLSVFGLTDLGITTVEWVKGLRVRIKKTFK